MNMDDSSLNAWLAAARAIHFAGCLLIAGVWVFDRIVLTGTTPAWRRTAIITLLIAMPVALVSALAWFVLVTANLCDLSIASVLHNTCALRLVWSQTHFGRVWQIHLALWCVSAMVAGVWAVSGRGGWIGLILGTALVCELAWAGHGSTGAAPFLHLPMDVLHLLACSVWPTGLVFFVLVVRSIVRSNDSDKWTQIQILTHRFSLCSLFAASTLTVSGFFSSWCLLGSISSLWTTAYGNVLLLKLGLFLIMLGFGAVNLLVMKPQLMLGESLVARLRFNVAMEIVLGTLVVVIVGLLGLLEPARPM